MAIAFIVLYIFANELTYLVACNQQMGLVQHISAGDLCWINRIMLIIPCVWYCGWIAGIALFVFTLFGLLHATVGWIFAIPTLFATNDKTVLNIVEVECNLLIPINIISLIFTISSFFVAKNKCTYNLIVDNGLVIPLLTAFAVCSVLRFIVVTIQKAKS